MNPIRVCNKTIARNLYASVTLGKAFFDSMLDVYGKDGWNTYSERLICHKLHAPIPQPLPGRDESFGCMPVCVAICLDREDFSNRDLSDLDLTLASMRHCNFQGAHLGASTLGCVEGSSFIGANLNLSRCDQSVITGCDFAHARLMGADFDRASYDSDDPPLHLPEAYFKRCSPFPQQWKQYPDPEYIKPCKDIQIHSVDLRCGWGESGG